MTLPHWHSPVSKLELGWYNIARRASLLEGVPKMGGCLSGCLAQGAAVAIAVIVISLLLTGVL
jgi:hypothetical protein